MLGGRTEGGNPTENTEPGTVFRGGRRRYPGRALPLPPGHELAHYRIVGPLGAGAMGEVYRARDGRLGREVAIKVLPEHFAGDAERLKRFEREAKALATLNHPNVAQIHGVDQQGDTCFLVLELVEGESLEERLKRGPLPVDEAIDCCRQIAEGLEAAHEASVIHRDLKPANVRVTPEGKVKVLDFGLAKPARDSHDGSSTDSVLSTEAGRLLGTPTYMAPEQARGKPIDRRVDVWAFGCVLYECLTGKRAFAGDTLTDVLGAVLHTEPDVAKLPTETPPRVRELLRDCLAKDPRSRARDIGEVRRQLELARHDPATRSAAPPRGNAWIAWTAAGVAAAAALGLGWRHLGSPAPRDRTYSFTIPQPDDGIGYPRISPDGRYLAFIGEGGLWLRDLAEPKPRFLPGTEGVREPFWSPDSRSIGFVAREKLKRVGLTGAPPEVLVDVPGNGAIGTWSSRGTILLDCTDTPESSGWYVLEPGAKELKRLRAFPDERPIQPDRYFPCFLPDGRHFLFTQARGDEPWLQVGDVDSDEVKPLVPADTRAMYAEPGWVLYVRRGTLWAQPFDADALEIRGEAVQVADEIDCFAITGQAGFTVSQEGTLAFRRMWKDARLEWFDREGRPAGTVMEAGRYQDIGLSADGRELAVCIADPVTSAAELWRVDLERGMPTRLTSTRRGEYNPRWSPDGTKIAFGADWKGPPNLHVWDLASGTEKEVVPFNRRVQVAGGWTSDGKKVLYHQRVAQGGSDLWMVDVESGERREIVASAFNEGCPVLAPNGEWFAFASNESGRMEIYLQKLGGAGERQRVSLDGGDYPKWSGAGDELFFVGLDDDSIESVSVEWGADGRPRTGAQRRLFQLASRFDDWAVAPDGKRFLLVMRGERVRFQPDEVVVGWGRRVP